MISEKNKITSGVEELDRLLGGGIIIGDNVIWYDDAGSLAPVFSLNLYSSLKASIGFIWTALCAGIIPARAPETTRMMSEAMALLKSTDGLLNMSVLAFVWIRMLLISSSSPTPSTRPI